MFGILLYWSSPCYAMSDILKKKLRKLKGQLMLVYIVTSSLYACNGSILFIGHDGVVSYTWQLTNTDLILLVTRLAVLQFVF